MVKMTGETDLVLTILIAVLAAVGGGTLYFLILRWFARQIRGS